MNPEIIVAALHVLAALVTGGMGLLIARERSLRQMAVREMDFQNATMEFAELAHEWGSISTEIDALIKETNVDRVLVLRAWNGAMRPLWTTAVLRVRDNGQDPISYRHYELDADYVDRLKKITAGQPLVFKTEDIPECGIKSIYQAEGVTESFWAHIGSKELKGSDSRAITYASFSTYEPAGMSEADITRCKLLVGRLKGIYRGVTPNAID